MARIRSIKPEFWTSEQVVECSIEARLLFIGLWNFCDDAGIHPASCKRIKMEVFPADDIDSASIRRMLDELSLNGLIVEYQADGKDYLQITGWHHQKIDRPTYRYPKPPRRAFDEYSGTESNGEESSGEDLPSQEEVIPLGVVNTTRGSWS